MPVVRVHDSEFVRVRVPAYLARSLQIALAAVHAPFFTDHEGAILTVVLRRDEWERLAPRFAAAEATAGFRLVSVHAPGSDPAFSSRLRQVLAERNVDAAWLPSFYNDYVLVPADEVERCLDALSHFLPG